MISEPFSQIVEIPNASLNEKLVAANDNGEATALSREHLEAESILARDETESDRRPFFFVSLLCVPLSPLIFWLWLWLA